MYGMFLYGQYDECTTRVVEVEKIVYVGGSHEQPTKAPLIPTVRVRLLRKEEEKFEVIVKSMEEF